MYTSSCGELNSAFSVGSHGNRLVSVIYNSTADSIMTVFDLEGVVSVQGGVSIPFYVEVVTSDGVTGVLNGEDTLAALEVRLARTHVSLFLSVVSFLCFYVPPSLPLSLPGK